MGTGLFIIRTDHIFLEEYERFDDEQAQKVMDKESDAYHQHSITRQAVEMADESDDEEEMKPLTSMDPAELSDLPQSAYGCFEDQ
eukprot:10823393-Karenia_brevis.AAC.1